MSSNSYPALSAPATRLLFFIIIIIAITIANSAQTEYCPAYYFLCMRPIYNHKYKKTNASWLSLLTRPTAAHHIYIFSFRHLHSSPPWLPWPLWPFRQIERIIKKMNAESALFTLMIFSLIIIFVNDNGKLHVTHPAPNSEQAEKPLFFSSQFRAMSPLSPPSPPSPC